MQNGRRMWSQVRGWLPLLIVVALLAMPSLAEAQGKKGNNKKQEEVAERSFTLPYVITATLIALGVVVTCMPVQREPGDLDRDLA